MRFPKQELNIDDYQQGIDQLLADPDCHLFIDTNIISQLYKLNDDARTDFFSWASTVSNRFHIPNWTVHEYQKRFCSQKTKDYLDELENKELVRKLKRLSNFARGYVSDSLLVGNTEYNGHKEQLFDELDAIAAKFEKINKAINNNLKAHQLKVHAEILDKLQPYTMDTDIYSILEEIELSGNIRYSHLIPPGFEDTKKPHNKFGDAIIWQEILSYCQNHNISKAIWITRDGKQDMTYTPQKQISGGHSIPTSDHISIAHESLVYEFYLKTGSNDFFVVNFLTLVKSISNNYQNLAISFQIVSTPEPPIDAEEESQTTEAEPTQDQQPVSDVLPQQNETTVQYSGDALADAGYDEKCSHQDIKLMIVGFKSHNWYKQNETAKSLMQWKPDFDTSMVNSRDMLFVLGRNVYQSAVGTSNDSMRYLQNLNTFLFDWDENAKKCLVDGMLYEVFFDSHGNIRPKEFKSKFFDVVKRQIDQMGLQNAYQFINESLSSKRNERFTPEVGTDKQYIFEFAITNEGLGGFRTASLKIDGQDASETFRSAIPYTFALRADLETKLSNYYAVPADKIIVQGLGDEVQAITAIC